MSEENRALQERLAEALEENQMLRSLQRFEQNPNVVVRHSGYGPQIIFDVGDGKSEVLEPNSKRNKASVPYDKYIDARKGTNWFEDGYLYTDEDLESEESNPNLILDLEHWVESRNEEEIREGIEEITSQGALNALYDLTEDRKDQGKYLVVRKQVAKRMDELFGFNLVEDE